MSTFKVCLFPACFVSKWINSFLKLKLKCSFTPVDLSPKNAVLLLSAFLKEKKKMITDVSSVGGSRLPLEGAAVGTAHLHYSGSLPGEGEGEGRLLAFSSLLLMAYSGVSDTAGSNRVHCRDSEGFPFCFLLLSPFICISWFLHVWIKAGGSEPTLNVEFRGQWNRFRKETWKLSLGAGCSRRRRC